MIYFDNAATTYPKPQSVSWAVESAIKNCANPGRGTHTLSMNAANEVFACRKTAAEMFGASPECVIFTAGATHSLNMAIKACTLLEGAVLISDLEHNAVVRPVIASGREVRVFSSAVNLCGEERTAYILASVKEKADGASVLISTAASNICGAAMPLTELGKLCRERGMLFIVDGAQAGGVYDIDMVRDGIDILCLPGHKGLYGPMGCGMMILGEGVEIPPLIYGGSGIDSRSLTMPSLPPERYEAGTLPVPLISGLRRGMEFVKRKTPAAIREHEHRLARILTRSLTDMGINVYAKNHTGGIVLFNIDGMTSEETAEMLDENGICVRGGLHCAPLAHDTLGSTGAVRVSFGVNNTEKEVYELLSVLKAKRLWISKARTASDRS